MAAFGGNQEQKAQDYMEEGEKILKKSKWSLFGSATKHEDAAEWFEKAARCLKVCISSGVIPMSLTPVLPTTVELLLILILFLVNWY